MKVLLLSLVLALLLADGFALKCNNCVPRSGGRCSTTRETCGYKQDACVSARFTIYPFSYFRRCIAMSDCMILRASAHISASCCQSDLCN
nr:CD59B glycoprotein-like [Misgurnus anguillicaudatus]